MSLPGRLVEGVRDRLRALPVASWRGVNAGFVLSTGRTGTLRLAQVLDQATEGVLALHEPAPDLFNLGKAVARGRAGADRAARMLRRTRQPLCNRVRRQGATAYVECNNHAVHLLGAVRAVFDEPRFVHVVRDGRATVRSLYSKTTRSRRPGHDHALFFDHDDHRCRLSATDFPDDPWAAEWPTLSRFERICWHWARKNALIREALAEHSDGLVVRFEDIFDAETGFPGFWEIVDFLDLTKQIVCPEPEIQGMLMTRSNRTIRYRIPEPDDWPPDLRARFDRIAGAEQRRDYPEA